MNTTNQNRSPISGANATDRASVLIIVIWVVFGLVSITLYFAHSMTFELRAADNRVAALESEQAIEGAARYMTCVLSNLNIRGSMPDQQTYQYEAVRVGNAHFWFIGRSPNDTDPQTMAHFGLVDEASKININYATSNMLAYLPNMTPDLIASILTWRSTNTTTMGTGAESGTYMGLQPPYLCKNSKFETVNELRMIYHMDMPTLFGEDANLNGALDANENDADVLPPTDNKDGTLDPGILDYLTVYSREPSTMSNGTTRVNITTFRDSASTRPTLIGALTNGTTITASRAATIINHATGGVRIQFHSPLEFFMRSGMTVDEIAQAEGNIRGTNIQGLINVNTASTEVLACVYGLDTGMAQTLTTYRQQNTNQLNGSIAWVTQVLPLQNAIQAGPWITGKTYQYSADVAAIGHNGRGYRRTQFIFDTSQGKPIIRHRQELSHLGWALGKDARDKWLVSK